MTQATIAFVDVGQGDCTIAVDHASGEGLIIDCPAGAHQRALDELSNLRCDRLSMVVVSHGHLDHFGGLIDIIEAGGDLFDGIVYVNLDSLYAIPVAGPDRGVAGKKLRAVLHRFREYSRTIQPALAGTDGDIGVLDWRFLSPQYDDVIAAVDEADPNLASVVVHLSAHGHDVLVGGDAPIEAWEAMCDDLPIGAVVRWPHHGGSIGSDERDAQRRLFDLTEPSEVAVSVGSGNTYGHPSAAFFEVARERAATFVCTQATPACVKGGAAGGRCAGSIRVSLDADVDYSISVDAPSHEAVKDAFGAAQCRP